MFMLSHCDREQTVKARSKPGRIAGGGSRGVLVLWAELLCFSFEAHFG
jgi:hypothetical protein